MSADEDLFCDDEETTRVTRRLLDRAPLRRAIAGANRAVLYRRPGEGSHWEQTDLGFAASYDLRIVKRVSKTHFKRLGTLRTRRAIELPKHGTRQWRRFQDALADDLRDLIACGIAAGGDDAALGPDPVLTVKLPTGRKVMVRPFLYRVLESRMHALLQPRFEAKAWPRLYSYRPEISRFHGLYAARRLMRDGYKVAAIADVRKFFPSTRLALVEEALDAEHPELRVGTRRLISWLHQCDILGRKQGKLVQQSCPRTLLTGTPLAGALSNVVGTYVFDRPFAKAMPRDVVMLRYADDMLILGTDVAAVADGMSLVNELAIAAGYSLHEEKSSARPINLNEESLRWLGLDLHGAEVRTPTEKIYKHVMRVCGARTPQRALQRVNELHRALLLDPAASLRVAEDGVCMENAERLDDMAAFSDLWRPRRKQILQGIHDNFQFQA